MRTKQTLNQNTTVATRQSTAINVTGWCNAIRKGAWSKKKTSCDDSDECINIRGNINREDDFVAV